MGNTAPNRDGERKRMSLLEWAALPEDSPGEFVDGYLTEGAVPEYIHELVIAWLIRVLGNWVSPEARSLQALAALLVSASLPGCRADCNHCTEATPATFHLSCSPNDLTSVVASGPCSMPNTAGLAFQTPSTSESDVTVFSAGPGVCHIELSFGTGFTYSTDVTFTQIAQECTCPSLFAATSGPFTVNNPSDTCVDAGLDAQAFDAEAGADAK